MQKLLLVDDDKEVLQINAKYFKQNGYEVKAATNAKAAIKILESYAPDCIVMDVMMPEMDGFAACKEMRKKCNTPIIFLTGKDSEDDKINGLMLGADDYVVKPYSLRELTVRIQVVIRRYQAATPSATSTIEFPPLRIELTSHKVYCDDEEVLLSNREYDLLHLLAASPNKIFTFEEIGGAVWGGYIDSDRKTIMVTMNRLRKKLGDYPLIADYIQTVWSKGYQFVTK